MVSLRDQKLPGIPSRDALFYRTGYGHGYGEIYFGVELPG
jgi:hypothetical protein